MNLLLKLLISLLVIAGGGILWHMGGQGKKWARQCVGPVIALGKALMLWSWLSLWTPLYILCLFGALALFSYGVEAPPHKFWVWIFGKGGEGDYEPVELATRATCGFFWSLAGLSISIPLGHLGAQFIYTVVCTLLCMFFGRQKDVRVSEVGTGCVVSLSVLL
jgi:hypothetical protein